MVILLEILLGIAGFILLAVGITKGILWMVILGIVLMLLAGWFVWITWDSDGSGGGSDGGSFLDSFS